MSSPGLNPHKKGEHVFNDIAGSVENALLLAIRTDRGNSLVLTNRFGQMVLSQFPQTSSAVDRIRRDPVLIQARTVVAPPTGIDSDANSRVYGDARLKLERILSDAVIATADLIWKKKPRSNSTFHDFESIVTGIRSASFLKADANSAIDALVDSAHDAQAEASALAEKVSDTELAQRRAAIAAMKQHRPTLKQAGHALVQTFLSELERVLERRIGSA
jgi:hypothetical protein